MRKGFALSRRGPSDLSRRDDRTKPGVLAPGADKRMIGSEGAGGWIVTREMTKRSVTDGVEPFQGGFVVSIILGLKPQAEFFYPFGISSFPFEA